MLSSIANELEQSPDLTPENLARTLRHVVIIDDVAPYIRFDPANYVRNLVLKTERYELRLLCWRPGQSTSMHGHGRSACAFRIIRGSAAETALGDRDRVWTPGSVIEESNARLVHQVANSGPDALLTLHAYSPPLPIDSPSPRAGHDIVIVGGGFAGVAVALHLLKQGGADLRVTLIERGPWLGRGVAYGVDSPIYRLNVPASKMSLDPAKPDDFVEWAGAQQQPHLFLPRTRYASYVMDRFAQVIRARPGKVRVIRGDVAEIEHDRVHLTDGRVFEARAVVLATGLAPRMEQKWLASDSRIMDAWDECALATLPREGRVLILGSGLTALDVLSVLHARAFQGAVTVLSRRGLLPRPHLDRFQPATPLSADEAAAAPSRLRPLIRWVRTLIERSVERGEPWQCAIDSLRPHVGRIWQSLPPEDRARFVRSVRPYWDVFRHRAPADALAVADAWGAAGRFELIAASVKKCIAHTSGLEVEIELRSGERRKERYDAIIRCIGPALEHNEREAPLIHSLLESGAAMADPAGLGVVTDEGGRVIAQSGAPSQHLFAVGALRRASHWETTAVPDITVHAARLAKLLVS